MKSTISPNVRHMKLTAVIWPSEEGGYCVLNPETGCASQGESVEEALANIEEATQAYLDEVPPKNFHPISNTFVTTFEIPTRA